MTNTIFCEKCGMLKNKCICSQNSNQTTTLLNRPDTKQKEQLQKEHPDIDDEIIENFPFTTARPNQLEIITEILNTIETTDKKYIILEAGTGTGKSVIAATLAQILQPAYIVTMTKQLQKQYTNEFGYTQVKGRNNFNCKDSAELNTCDIGTCQTSQTTENFQCPYGIKIEKTTEENETNTYKPPFTFNGEEHCSYWAQKSNAITEQVTLLNYDYAYLELNYVKHFPKRNIMILDEAHNIEDKIMHKLELNLYNARLKKDIKREIPSEMRTYTDVKDWVAFLESVYDSYSDLNTERLTKQKLAHVEQIKRKIMEITKNIKKDPKNWIVAPDKDEVSFKPLKVDNYTQDTLFEYADHILFMSATILDKDLFCKWLGISKEDVHYISTPSPFKKENRQIHMKLVGPMSKRALWHTAPKTIPVLQEILEKHPNQKGLIHTNSYQCQKYITDHIKDSRILSHTPKNRERILYHFENTNEPLVLVSPSMSEGVDLPYEKCEFQVIYKIPYPYLGDKQIDQRRKLDPEWYAYKTVMTLMQAYGRGMRAENDQCQTYVIDKNMEMILRNKMFKRFIPEFFKEAIVK
ncbi:MAG: ATP-dependent DNA helicase [Methanobacteriaceae archaeon]|nr:ATP-dependent DNA helicase [Methanobacteriaceae archaeon]